MNYPARSGEASVSDSNRPAFREETIFLLPTRALAENARHVAFLVSNDESPAFPPRLSVRAGDLAEWYAVQPAELHQDAISLMPPPGRGEPQMASYNAEVPRERLRRLDEIAVPSDFDRPPAELHRALGARLHAVLHPQQGMSQRQVHSLGHSTSPASATLRGRGAARRGLSR